ncbi:MAG: PKD domain-containing protein [Bryobacteraceae bacterium]
MTTQASKDDWEEINFEFNSGVLSDGYPSLLRLADLLHKNTGYHVKVEGNTDNIGSGRYNEKLGMARANTIKDFLVKYGANASQIDVSTRGKTNPEVRGYKPGYSKTDVARWMNRRVVLTVTDQNGKTVSAGGVGEAIAAIPPSETGPNKCCDDILKRLDEISAMLKGLTDQNAGLKQELADLKNKEAGLENKVSNLPKPLNEAQTAQVVDTRLEKFRDPRFSLLGLNIGADDHRQLTFSGSGRFFAPFKDHFAVQIQGEYLYYRTQKEGQADIGLVNRIGNFQGGLFGSFKTVTLQGAGNTGTLAQGSAVFDYIFSLGKVGLFGSKGFLNNAVLDQRALVLGNGSIAPNVLVERYLRIVDQVGGQGTFALWGNSYMQANLGYLRAYGHPDRPGATVRFVFPWGNRFAFTLEGGVNETLLGRDNTGRAVVGFQIGNFLRPREFAGANHAIPMEVPRVRYEVLERRLRNGVSPPIADAGPDQIGVPAGTITLNGSNSRDPNGEALTFQWVQEAGPAVSLSSPTSAVTTFPAAAGEAYSFRLTVRNTDAQQASARVRVTTTAPQKVQILFFTADPLTIDAGQRSTLSWRVLNAETVTISPGVGNVNPTNGNVAVQPTATTTYTLTARNANGSDTATVSVVVRQTQPSFTACTASPMNIMAGESSTIFFSSLNATSVSISNGIGNVGMSGSVVVSPTTNTNYIVTATNQFGSATCSVSVQVTPGAAPRIVKFTASPLSIQQGATSTLLWLVENARDVTITPGIGSVSNADTRDVQPTQTTTYTLTATNKFGSVSAQATVTVIPVPPPPVAPSIASFTANPPASTTPGSAVVLSCKANNANQVVISGVGPVDANGNLTVNPVATTTYVCVAVGANGQQASANLTVPVTTGPVTTTPGPTVSIISSGGACTQGTATLATVCETVVRTITLDLSGSVSAAGNNPLTFMITSRNTAAAILNSTSSMPIVQLSELFGDYFFDVTVTDSKGNKTTVPVDVRLIVTRVR